MSGTLRITKLEFAFGAHSDDPEVTSVDPSTVVLLVGPNNAGKSLALREMEDLCRGHTGSGHAIRSVELDFPRDPDTAENMLRTFEIVQMSTHEQGPPGHARIGQYVFPSTRSGSSRSVQYVSIEDFRRAVLGQHKPFLKGQLAALYTVRLDGRTRFQLSDPQPARDLLGPQDHHIGALFVDDAARERVRALSEEAFGLHFVIDPTNVGYLRIRMSDRAPQTKAEEQGWDEIARRFHSAAPLISELSDGVQAFIGLVSAVLSLPHKIILIDEPEAFLHPSLARRTGRNLAKVAAERDASLVAATHSADFLLGCIESVQDTTVVRLQRERGVASARVLSPEAISAIAADPLMRSTDVLQALFHRAAVVTEGDTDRAFYDEINHRLLGYHRGIEDAKFLNAQNKQTIHKLVAPLRRIGVPAAAVVDLDILEDATTFRKLLTSCNIPDGEIARLETERNHLAAAFAQPPKSSGVRAIKRGGIDALGASDRDRARGLLRTLASYGVFLVPGGEVETWLASARIPGTGADWLVNLFMRIQSGGEQVLRPKPEDVWRFIDEIASWVSDPSRKGLR